MMLDYEHETISRIVVLVLLNKFFTRSQCNYNEIELQQ